MAEIDVMGGMGCYMDRVAGLVRAKVLTQMDGRDLVRCRATEEHCGVEIFCVSQEEGAVYRMDRHLRADINSRNFVRQLKKHFGRRQFDQIVLDYFWIPRGWDRSHWKASFFTKTLMAFAEVDVLSVYTLQSEFLDMRRATGTIYLPFSLHCLREIAIAFDKLSAYYRLSFLRKGDLDEVTLWAGTQTVDRDTMAAVFGKQLDQEEIYCVVTKGQLRSVEDDPRMTRAMFMNFVECIGDISSVRFIVLELLPR